MAEYFGIPNAEYIGTGVGVLILIFFLWRYFSSRRGRLGEEIKEEKETNALKKDEKIVERAQKDEMKQCRVLKKLFMDLWERLKLIQKGELQQDLRRIFMSILDILDKLEKEKMSVQKALQNFRTLHTLTGNLINQLPRGDRKMDKIIKNIKKHHDTYYSDLIQELKMDEDKKQRLRVLWTDVQNEVAGTGKV